MIHLNGGIYMNIRQAKFNEYERIRDFYYILIDDLDKREIPLGWKRDIYPSQEFLKDCLNNQELYIGEINGRIASAMILNHNYNDEYKGIEWLISVNDEELLVIHTLGVNPQFSGKGLAKEMVKYAIDHAREEGIKSVRLDVWEANILAEKVYLNVGFEYRDTIQMYYADTGYRNYKIFEYKL